MAWLLGFNKRIKLTADSTKIDSDLSQFPLTIFLKSGNGDTAKVFDEVGSNKYKIAVTKSDGTTQLYVEIEKWDDTNKVGVLHAGLDGDTLSSSADTDYYLYYDNSASDNTTYVGDINSTAGANVWDSNAKAIYHLTGAAYTDLYDSTSNDNDIVGENGTPDYNTAAKIGNGIGLAHADDEYVKMPDTADIEVTDFTVEIWAYITDVTLNQHIFSRWGNDPYQWQFHIGEVNSSQLTFSVYNGSTRYDATYSTDLVNNTWYHFVGVADNTNNIIRLYVDGTEVANTTTSGTFGSSGTQGAGIGSQYDGGKAGYTFGGTLDEARFHSGVRSAAWIKGEYNSTNDTLLTYGTEETGSTSYTLTADTGSYSLTGQISNLKAGYKMIADTGSYTLTGISVLFKRGYGIIAETGQYILSGINTGLKQALKLTAGTGNYSLSGIGAGLKAGYKIVASVGQYTLSGISAGLLTGYKLIAETGSYTLSGVASTLKLTSKLVASVGSYILTGIEATLKGTGNWLWRDVTKHNSIWTDLSKHDSTWTDTTKHSSIWTDQTKHPLGS